MTFEIDANGILSVDATELGTGRKQQVQIRASGGLSERDIQGLIQEAQQHHEADVRRKKLVELRHQGEGLIYTTTKSVEEYSSYLSPVDIQEVQNDIQLLKDCLHSQDQEELELAIKNLEQSAYRISDAIYRKASENQ